MLDLWTGGLGWIFELGLVANLVGSVLVACRAYNLQRSFWRALVGGLCFSCVAVLAYDYWIRPRLHPPPG